MFLHPYLQFKKIFFFTFAVVIIQGMMTEIRAELLKITGGCAGLCKIERQQDLYKYDPVDMANMKRLGCPPCKKWQPVVNSSAGAGGEGSPVSMFSRLPAHTFPLGYKAKNVCSDMFKAKPGGQSDDGAVDPCTFGMGKPAFNLNIMMPKIPQITAPNIDCLSNLYGMLTSFKADLMPQLTGNVNGSCASGTVTSAIVGECGMDDLSKNVCVGQQNDAETEDTTENTTVPQLTIPFSRKVPPTYVVEGGVKEMVYENNALNTMTSIQLPNGGTVTFTVNTVETGDACPATATINAEGNCVYTYVLDINNFVTMNSTGEVFFGPNWTGTYPVYTLTDTNRAKTNDRIYLEPSTGALEPVMSYVSIIPNGEVVNVDSAIYEGDTLNQQVDYCSYNTTTDANPEDGRTSTNAYDPRANTVDMKCEAGPGAQPAIEPEIADLAGLPPAEIYNVGAHTVGLSNAGVSNGQPTLQCPPELSLFCQERPNQQINDTAPAAAQYP